MDGVPERQPAIEEALLVGVLETRDQVLPPSPSVDPRFLALADREEEGADCSSVDVDIAKIEVGSAGTVAGIPRSSAVDGAREVPCVPLAQTTRRFTTASPREPGLGTAGLASPLGRPRGRQPERRS